MALASDLMGLGVAPLQAARTATGGTGPLSIAQLGSTFGTAAALGSTQFIVTSTGLSGGGIKLPAIGGDTGCFLADDYFINNSGTSSLIVYANPSGGSVLISLQGSNGSTVKMQIHQSLVLYPISTTQWVGILS